MKKGILLILFLTTFLLQTQAQTWRSELYPANWQAPTKANFYTDKLIQDFSYAGYRRGEQEISNKRQHLLDVTKAPYNADNTGKQDVTTVLQKALDDAGSRPGGAVVYLPPGTYQVSPPGSNNYCLLMRNSNVVLRGAGSGHTFIFNAANTMRGKAIIKIDNGNSWAANGPNKQAITSDLMSPTTVIPVQNTTGFKVGDLVIVRNYIDNDWIAEHNMTEYWQGKGDNLAGQLYCREIMAINSKKKEITIDIPIRYALKDAHGAAVYKAPAMLTEVGVEDIAIGNRQNFTEGDWSEESYTKPANGSYQSHDSWAIAMAQVYNGWIRRIASYAPAGNTSGAHLLSNGIKVWQTKNVSILNCHFSSPQFGGGGGNGYMYRVMGNETLLQDCIAENNRHGYVMSHMSASGNVFYRCLDKNTGRQTGLTGQEKTSGSGSDHHMHFSHSNLFDQCKVENSFFAAGWRKWGGSTIHGLTAAHSLYWNLNSSGKQAQAVQTQQGRYGYVIGTSGDKPAVSTAVWQPGTEKITDPVDHVEGIGTGQKLQPQSLYQDQKHQRLTNPQAAGPKR
ncbi:hypothetical protein AAE02nite_48510 [Adhaeribacter aerolatus]|uniref:Rhamnogalacturonase A/B/Epimerase-like pectate lyase domain-containing protein n=1 Tax=Adhaeribacter aerolatus TaxID=670289 RepID=A0A512B5Y1_9BACT|nr:glycosyl hydrolase family 28-related protein [Adhaeribacter aerolatus]GEO07187.1 hypothetical protein AAE02nite_48510 [Adhaeribacter aerolatus]